MGIMFYKVAMTIEFVNNEPLLLGRYTHTNTHTYISPIDHNFKSKNNLSW